MIKVKSKIQNSKSEVGFTLVELMIASGLFIILISIATGAFINTLRTQRIITDLSESLNNTSFAIEQIAREVRVGFGFDDGGETLTFFNSSGNEVVYSLRSNGENGGGSQGIERCESGVCRMITAPEVNLSNLEFVLQGDGEGDGEPPRVTILISVLGEKNIKVDLQTTISSRILDS